MLNDTHIQTPCDLPFFVNQKEPVIPSMIPEYAEFLSYVFDGQIESPLHL